MTNQNLKLSGSLKDSEECLRLNVNSNIPTRTEWAKKKAWAVKNAKTSLL